MSKQFPRPNPKESLKSRHDFLLQTLAELFFALLPFIILTIVFTYKHELSSMIFISEWSFAAAFLNGQGLVKFVIKIIEVSGKARKTPLLDRIAVFLTCFIVILFVPSLVILALVVLDNKQTVGLAIAQVILFIISAGIYVYLGYLLKQLESGRSLLKQIEF